MNYSDLQKNLFKRVEEAQLFTTRFASFNKSDYEVLLFTVYLDCLQEEVNDYEISINLGIPESKVRTLRIKSQLQYPRDIKWKEKMVSAIEHGTYDSVQKMITLTIEDPSVRNRIRYEAESRFGTVNFSLNSKQLILPVECVLIIAACAENDIDAVLKKLNKELRKSKVPEIEKGNFKKRFFQTVNDVGVVVGTLSAAYTMGKPIIEALMSLIS